MPLVLNSCSKRLPCASLCLREKQWSPNKVKGILFFSGVLPKESEWSENKRKVFYLLALSFLKKAIASKHIERCLNLLWAPNNCISATKIARFISRYHHWCHLPQHLSQHAISQRSKQSKKVHVAEHQRTPPRVRGCCLPTEKRWHLAGPSKRYANSLCLFCFARLACVLRTVEGNGLTGKAMNMQEMPVL